MRVALVHDFLTQLGGAERVLEVLHEMFSEAPVYTLVYDEKKTRKHFSNWDVKTSFIQKLPGGVAHYQWFLGLMPYAIESFNFAGIDLVISDASAFAKGIRVPEGIPHICYCHTPTRYIWQMQDEYIASLSFPAWALKLARPVLLKQKKWDYRAAQKVTKFIANSNEVRDRIKKFYNRDSEVVHPPARTDFFSPPSFKPTRNYYLCVGRLVPYKRIEIAIEACKKLNSNLKIVGTGLSENRLRALGGDNIEFLGRVSDVELKMLYQNAKALIFPALEDAGLVMVESLASGTPVVAFGAGGALEFIEPGKHGELFAEQSQASLVSALKHFSENTYDSSVLRSQAEKFSEKQFKESLFTIVKEVMHENRN